MLERPAPETIANAPVDAAVVALPDELDVRPETLDIPPPEGDFALRPLPDDVHAEVPPEGWWKKKGACPKGSKLKKTEVDVDGVAWRAYECVGAASPKPFTGWALSGTDREEGWEDENDAWHGVIHYVQHGWDRIGVFIHGKEEGKQVERSPDGDERFAHYRDGQHHGLEYVGFNSRPEKGYWVDGHKEGVWLSHSLDGLVKARLTYHAGVLHGPQRWWYASGAVLARATLTDGDGRWEIFDEAGRLLSRTDCDGEKLVEVYAWDDAGNVTVHGCGPAAPADCAAAVGPTDYQGRQALGADDDLCELPWVNPLEKW